jgi:hypothetical protein
MTRAEYFIDALCAIGTLICMAAIGVMLAWRG